MTCSTSRSSTSSRTATATPSRSRGSGSCATCSPIRLRSNWDIADGWATSADLPGVRIPGAPFMGIIGLSPGHELLAATAAREQALLDRGGFVLPPLATSAVPVDSLRRHVASLGLATPSAGRSRRHRIAARPM